jgi:hypothetical protein
MGKFHGRSSRQWNLEDDQVGRKVWYRSFDVSFLESGLTVKKKVKPDSRKDTILRSQIRSMRSQIAQ